MLEEIIEPGVLDKLVIVDWLTEIIFDDENALTERDDEEVTCLKTEDFLMRERVALIACIFYFRLIF